MAAETFDRFLNQHGIQKAGLNLNYDCFHVKEIAKMSKTALMQNFMFDKETAKKIYDLLNKRNAKPARKFVRSLINKTFEPSPPFSKFKTFYKNVTKDDFKINVRDYMDIDVISAAYAVSFNSFKLIYKRAPTTSFFFGKKECINQANSKGWSALMYAATTNQGKIVNYLLNKGANLKLQEFHGKTALMFAASYGKVLTIKIFQEYAIRRAKLFSNKPPKEALKHEIGLQIVDENSYTALHYAVYSNQYDEVALLMELDADLDIMDKFGKSSIDYAKYLPTEDILLLLQNRSKKLPTMAKSQNDF